MTPNRRLAIPHRTGKHKDRTMTTPQERTALVDQIEAMTPAEAWRPASEVVRTARGVTYHFDLPGVLPKNLHLSCRDGRLLVWGHRNVTGAVKLIELTSNRPTGAFAAEAAIPETLDASRIWNEYHDGVLTVIIPERRASRHRS
jgi:HSP20 family molecular chaperone IbpA